ncbi:MAG: hypothetical protein ACPG5T_02815 [Endozoicomonas sp.]
MKVEANNPGALDSGEKRLEELKKELKRYETRLLRENLRQNLVEWYRQEKRRIKSENVSSATAVVHGGESRSPLKAEFVNQAAALHIPSGAQSSAEVKGRADLSGQQVEDTLEALSLILKANLPAGEKRADQSGTENDLFSDVTEAFTWKQVDALLDQLYGDIEQWSYGVSGDTPEESLAIELLESQHYVDAMVAEALQDVEQAGLSIRNRPV